MRFAREGRRGFDPQKRPWLLSFIATRREPRVHERATRGALARKEDPVLWPIPVAAQCREWQLVLDHWCVMPAMPEAVEVVGVLVDV